MSFEVSNKLNISPAAMDPQVYQPNQSIHISNFPDEMFLEIFSLAKAALLEIVQVSQKWKEMAYDEEFYKRIVPSLRFGEKDWIRYIGIPEKETHIPYCVFKDIESGPGYLTWVTKTVKLTVEDGNLITNGDGTVKLTDKYWNIITNEDGTVQEVTIDANNIGELVKNPKEGHPTGYHPLVWRKAIEEQRPQEESHWVWIREEPIGRGKNYQEQQLLAKGQSLVKNAKGEDVFSSNVSGLLDTNMTAFMEKIRSGKSCFAIGPVKGQSTWIRVQEKTRGIRVGVGFAAAGFDVYFYDDYDYGYVVVLVARKSIGR